MVVSWQAKAQQKRHELRQAIPEAWRLPVEVLTIARQREQLVGSFIEGLMDEKTCEITGHDSSVLLSRIAAGEYSAYQVTTAFCRRTAIASQLTNSVVEICFSSALAQARVLDKEFAANRYNIGPLHGLPVTLKDQFHIPGHDTAMGYVGWIGTQGGTQTQDGRLESELVRDLRALGAVPIAKTSNAQTLWCGETNNNIVGYCMNPWKQSLSSGGSSGGQAALQALRGSVVGFGTDIGGSVSMPAAFNGLYSIKPTQGRITAKGVVSSSLGQPLIDSVVGIMGCQLSDVSIMFKSLLSAQPWLKDSTVLHLPFRPDIGRQVRKRADIGLLTFGYLEDDGYVLPHPPITRALRQVKEALEMKSYKWDPPPHRRAGELHQAITNADGAADIYGRLKLSGEPLIPELKDEFGEKAVPSIPLTDFYRLKLQLESYRDLYTEYWSSTEIRTENGTPIDAIIMPAATSCAVLPGEFHHYGKNYSTFANTMNLPAVVVPVTTADAKIDRFPPDYHARNETERKSCMSYYPTSYHGAPVGIQILARPLEEEKLLAIAQLVVEAMQKSSKGP